MKWPKKVDGATPFRLLTRLFLRRLIDNDLISPHADRHEPLAVLYALVVSLAVFVTFFISTNYLSAFFMLPGKAAMSALSDRFLFISASVVICALAALLVWDALALETRDAAILGPLPVAARTIICAKLAAALVFGAAFAVAVNAVPSVLYPLFLTLNMRGASGLAVYKLIGGQAATVVMAGVFGFSCVLALRGVLRLGLGGRGFRRVSSVVQSALLVCAVTALLLTPTVRAARVQEWIAGEQLPRWPAVPLLWYLGVNEQLAGHVVAEIPVALPRGLMFVPSLQRPDEAGRAAYRALGPRFAALARTGWLSLPFVMGIAIATFLWNNRRLPEQSTGGSAQSSRIMGATAARLTRANPETQAGFFFTWQTLTRSAPHRTIMAISLAAGLTLPLLTLAASGIHRLETQSMPLGFLGLDIMVVTALIAGLRYAVIVPAELSSNWTIRMAWQGDERGYLAGVKLAGLVGLVTMPLVVLLLLHVLLFGPMTALAHALHGFLFATAAIEGIFLGYRRVPFACSYVPFENPKLFWPIATVGFVLVTYGFASMERFALETSARSALVSASLVFVVLVARFVDLTQRRERIAVNFDERPAQATLRLGLFDRIALRD